MADSDEHTEEVSQLGRMTPGQEIASDQLDMLREHPERCGWVSNHVGDHPWVRWNQDRGCYEIARTSGTGRLEVEGCDKRALLNLFAENPVHIIPLSEATYSPPEPGESNVWEAAEEDGEHVIHADGGKA